MKLVRIEVLFFFLVCVNFWMISCQTALLPLEPSQKETPLAIVILPKDKSQQNLQFPTLRLPAFHAWLNQAAQEIAVTVQGDQIKIHKRRGQDWKVGSISYTVFLKPLSKTTENQWGVMVVDKSKDTPFDFMQSLFEVEEFRLEEMVEYLKTIQLQETGEEKSRFSLEMLVTRVRQQGASILYESKKEGEIILQIHHPELALGGFLTLISQGEESQLVYELTLEDPAIENNHSFNFIPPQEAMKDWLKSVAVD